MESNISVKLTGKYGIIDYLFNDEFYFLANKRKIALSYLIIWLAVFLCLSRGVQSLGK